MCFSLGLDISHPQMGHITSTEQPKWAVSVKGNKLPVM